MFWRKVASLYCFLKLLKDFLRICKTKNVSWRRIILIPYFYKPPELFLFKGERACRHTATPHKPTTSYFEILIKGLLNTKPFEFRIIFRSAPCSTKDEIHMVKFGSVRNSDRQVFLVLLQMVDSATAASKCTSFTISLW